MIEHRRDRVNRSTRQTGFSQQGEPVLGVLLRENLIKNLDQFLEIPHPIPIACKTFVSHQVGPANPITQDAPLAFIPNPIFDIAGAAAGALGMPIYEFLFWAWIGKTLKMLMFAYAGATSADWLLQMFGVQL